MTQVELLRSQLADLHAMARFQRALRLSLRVIWLFSAGIIAGWGLNKLGGFLPSWPQWLLLGLALAILPLIDLIRTFSPRRQWVWLLDRRLGLQEQVSTAYDVAERGQSGPVQDALVSDVVALLPGIQERVWKRGWFLERELASLAIIVLLSVMILTTHLIRSYQGEIQRFPITMEQMPSLADDPKMEEVFPQGPLGIEQQPQGGGQGSQPQTGGENGAQGDQPGQQPGNVNEGMGALEDALQKMGEQLSGQAPTYDLGQALEQMDLEAAAGEMEKLGEQLEGLSPETKQELAQAMEEAAGNLAGTPQQGLGQKLDDAADALQQNAEGSASEEQARQELNDLAESLRDLSGEQQNSSELASGGGAGNGASGSTGQAQSNDRLQGQGEDFKLEVDDPSQSGLLNPAPPDAAGSGTAGGSLDSPASAGQDVIQSMIVPNSFLWKWRDVVSSYFQH